MNIPTTYIELWEAEKGWGADGHGPEFTFGEKAWDAATLAERARMAAAHLKSASTERDLMRPLNERERAILAPPHPVDFGIPEKHWEATKNYAIFFLENRAKASKERGNNVLSA